MERLSSWLAGTALAPLFASAVLAAAADCGGGSGPGPVVTGDSALDSDSDVAIADPDAPDPGPADPFPADPSPDDAAPKDDGGRQPDAACGGAAGCFCTADDQCKSGFCTGTPGGAECARACDGGCPAGWACLPAPAAPSTLVCVAPSQLCRPCRTDTECEGPLPGNHLCVPQGPAGSFCGASCAASGACPDGFSCTDVPAAGGGTARQCVPSGGAACPCPDRFAAFKTECFVENASGKCTADRTCAESCPAATPAPEACNGKDDDCDGDTDEGAATGCADHFADADGDGFGTGEPACRCGPTPAYPAAAGGDCNDADEAVHPGASVCGTDGDCDGSAPDAGEECDDGNADPGDACRDCKPTCPPDTFYAARYCWVNAMKLSEPYDEACARYGKTALPKADLKAAGGWTKALRDEILAGFGYELVGDWQAWNAPVLFCEPGGPLCEAHGWDEFDYYWNSFSVPIPNWRAVYACIP
ncbi:MAG: hypothetical protein FJ087_15430 [Deltaproteobacteria bacterium]|nr:hypothetical protein [Deltaproteobacteria bacterium]